MLKIQTAIGSDSSSKKSMILGKTLWVATVICATVLISKVGQASDATQSGRNAIQACLENWDKHPFGKDKNPQFKILASEVKVLGIGKNIRDDEVTSQPQLVLVEPNVAVLSKTKMELLNPKGWYCLQGKVAVLGKTEITIHCDAHLTSTNRGVNVLGGSDRRDGVHVLGTSRIVKVGCKEDSRGDKQETD